MSDHFNLVNNSTMFGNYNSGKIIDESRYSSMQKVQNNLRNQRR